MKKKNLIIVSIVVIVLLLVISIFLPKVGDSDSAGTIGKVDKYRNKKTGQDIVFFRNGFLQDTVSLKAVINLLAVNENVIEKLPKEFKEWESSLKETLNKDKKLASQFSKLNDLAVYLTNNISTIKSTRLLLTKYFTKDTVDMKIDVQNNLIQFDGFINNLNEKSKVLDTLFLSLNGIIDNENLKKLNYTKEETGRLKEIREKMLGSMTMYAITCGVQTTLNTVLNSKVNNMVIFNKELNSYVSPLYATSQLGGNMPILNVTSDKYGVVAPAAKELGNQLNFVLSREIFSGIEVGNISKVDLNSFVYSNKVDMTVSNILCCKDLGIVSVGNQFFLGAAKNKEAVGFVDVVECYIVGAQSLGKIKGFPDHLQ